MSYSKLIHEYLDGELIGVREDLLFSQLAGNSDLRNEINQQVKLHFAAHSDMRSISTPVECTNTVFASLGFSIPSGEFVNRLSYGASGSSALIEKPILGFMKQHLGIIITLLLSLAVGSFMWLINHDIPLPIANKTHSIEKATIPVVSSFDESAGDAINRITKPVKSIAPNKTNSTFASNQQTNSPIEESITIVEDRNSAENIMVLGTISTEVFEKFHISPAMNNNVFIPVTSNNNRNLFKVQQPNSNWTLILSRISTNNTKEVKVPGETLPINANWAITGMYNFDENHSIGLTAGWEQFSQEFTAKNNEQNEIWKQNPVIFWYGGAYRLSLPSWGIDNILYPYVQIIGGATSIGAIGKAQIGIQYQPFGLFRMHFGVEGGNLFYNVQGKNYNSTKYGISGGVSFNF